MLVCGVISDEDIMNMMYAPLCFGVLKSVSQLTHQERAKKVSGEAVILNLNESNYFDLMRVA
jgi:hypothetical protein